MTHAVTGLTCTQTAALVRAAVTAAFPGTRFTVRSNRYTGGGSIRVTWTDGPSIAAVEPLLDRYRRSDFNLGNDDRTTHREPGLLAFPDHTVAEVRYGADFVYANRMLSDTYRTQLRAITAGLLGEDADPDLHYGTISTPYGLFDGGNGRSLLRFLADTVPPRTADDRLFYIGGYLTKLAADPDYLRFGGVNQISEGLRMLITKHSVRSPWNTRAERAIREINKPGTTHARVVAILNQLRALA
jgi:hypothetical protein